MKREMSEKSRPDFHVPSTPPGGVQYDPLRDVHLRAFFNRPDVRDALDRTGLPLPPDASSSSPSSSMSRKRNSPSSKKQSAGAAGRRRLAASDDGRWGHVSPHREYNGDDRQRRGSENGRERRRRRTRRRDGAEGSAAAAAGTPRSASAAKGRSERIIVPTGPQVVAGAPPAGAPPAVSENGEKSEDRSRRGLSPDGGDAHEKLEKEGNNDENADGRGGGRDEEMDPAVDYEYVSEYYTDDDAGMGTETDNTDSGGGGEYGGGGHGRGGRGTGAGRRREPSAGTVHKPGDPDLLWRASMTRDERAAAEEAQRAQRRERDSAVEHERKVRERRHRREAAERAALVRLRRERAMERRQRARQRWASAGPASSGEDPGHGPATRAAAQPSPFASSPGTLPVLSSASPKPGLAAVKQAAMGAPILPPAVASPYSESFSQRTLVRAFLGKPIAQPSPPARGARRRGRGRGRAASAHHVVDPAGDTTRDRAADRDPSRAQSPSPSSRAVRPGGEASQGSDSDLRHASPRRSESAGPARPDDRAARSAAGRPRPRRTRSARGARQGGEGAEASASEAPVASADADAGGDANSGAAASAKQEEQPAPPRRIGDNEDWLHEGLKLPMSESQKIAGSFVAPPKSPTGVSNDALLGSVLRKEAEERAIREAEERRVAEEKRKAIEEAQSRRRAAARSHRPAHFSLEERKAAAAAAQTAATSEDAADGGGGGGGGGGSDAADADDKAEDGKGEDGSGRGGSLSKSASASTVGGSTSAQGPATTGSRRGAPVDPAVELESIVDPDPPAPPASPATLRTMSAYEAEVSKAEHRERVAAHRTACEENEERREQLREEIARRDRAKAQAEARAKMRMAARQVEAKAEASAASGDDGAAARSADTDERGSTADGTDTADAASDGDGRAQSDGDVVHELVRSGDAEALSRFVAKLMEGKGRSSKDWINARDDTTGRTPICAACALGDAGCAAVLLDCGGAELEATADDGATALIEAIAAPREATDLVERLLGAGAAVNAFDGEGRTPVFLAAEAGRVASVRLLMAAGANPHITDVNGDSAVSRAVDRGDPALVAALEDEVGDDDDDDGDDDGSGGGGDARSLVAAGDGGEASGVARTPSRAKTTMSSSSIPEDVHVARPHVIRVGALCPFHGVAGTGEIPLKVDDSIEVLAMSDDGWWEGRLVDGTTGLFPVTHTTGNAFRVVTPYECARAAADYTAREPDEISVRDKDVVIILRRQADGWWLARGPDGSVGLVPSNHLIAVP